MMGKAVYILNGPNLNLLGLREPDVYGHETLGDIEARLAKQAAGLGLKIDFRQSNSEGELVDWLQEAGRDGSGVVLNAGAYTHTSVALHDVLLSVNIPVIEVHISNIFAREDFRHHSYISKVADGVICGLGVMGYEFGLIAIERKINKKN